MNETSNEKQDDAEGAGAKISSEIRIEHTYDEILIMELKLELKGLKKD